MLSKREAIDALLIDLMKVAGEVGYDSPFYVTTDLEVVDKSEEAPFVEEARKIINKAAPRIAAGGDRLSAQQAKQLLDKITDPGIIGLLYLAKEDVDDWTEATNVNPGISYGKFFNMAAKAIKESKSRRINAMTRENIIRVFGHLLPLEMIPEENKKEVKPIHEEPNFDLLPQKDED